MNATRLAVLALPAALAGCPQFLSDWKVAAGASATDSGSSSGSDSGASDSGANGLDSGATDSGLSGGGDTRVADTGTADTGTAVKLAAVTAGASHACALTTAGGVQCWGDNSSGDLGNNATTQSNVPVAVSGLSSGVAAIAAGQAFTCALTTAGGVQCWGGNGNGALGNNTTTDSHVPVAVSGLSSGVVAIAAGQSHSCALTTAGGVQCWGFNSNGQLGNNSTTTQSNVPVAVSGLSSGVAAIAAGDLYGCALTTAGGIQCWGNNPNGQPSLVPVAVSGLSSGVAAIAAGSGHACALTTAGAALCWGDNSDGQLGNNSTTQSNVPVAVSGLSSGVAALAAGQYHTCALTTAGAAVCWGDNELGELGNNSTTQSNVPVAVSGLSSGVAAIAAAKLGYFSCALTTGGGVQCWGLNNSGELGNNSTTNSLVPVPTDE
jgi:alpha-tubulin suppressor-like RCC1 family protein